MFFLWITHYPINCATVEFNFEHIFLFPVKLHANIEGSSSSSSEVVFSGGMHTHTYLLSTAM